MDEADDLEQVAAILEAAGLRPERVSEARTKRCDFFAEDNHDRYLVEVKAIHHEASLGAALKTGAIYDSK